MALIEELIRYVERFDPEFSTRITGADDGLVDRFRELVAHPLPQAYLGFLSRLGIENGGLQVAGDACTDLSELVSYYEEELQSGEWEEPADCVVIAVTGIAFDSMYLHYDGDGEPKVAVSWRNGLRHHADTFGGLLFREAYTGFHMPSQSWMATYESETSDRQIGAAGERFELHGLQVHWFSDSIAVCAESENGVTIAATQFSGDGCKLGINVAGPSRDAVESVAKGSVLTIPGVRFERWFRRGAEPERPLLDTVEKLLNQPYLGPPELTALLNARLSQRAQTNAFTTLGGPCDGPVAESIEVRVPRGGREGLVILTVRITATEDQAAVITRFGEPHALRPSDPNDPERRVDFEYRRPNQKLCFCFDAETGHARYVVIDRIVA